MSPDEEKCDVYRYKKPGGQNSSWCFLTPLDRRQARSVACIIDALRLQPLWQSRRTDFVDKRACWDAADGGRCRWRPRRVRASAINPRSRPAGLDVASAGSQNVSRSTPKISDGTYDGFHRGERGQIGLFDPHSLTLGRTTLGHTRAPRSSTGGLTNETLHCYVSL